MHTHIFPKFLRVKRDDEKLIEFSDLKVITKFASLLDGDIRHPTIVNIHHAQIKFL